MKVAAVIVVMSLLALAACAGTTQVSTPGADVNAGPQGVQVTTPGADVNAGSQGAQVTTGGGKTLGEVLSAAKGIKYKVDYDVTAGSVTTKMTQIVKLPQFAIDTTTSGVQSKVIFNGADIIACTNQGTWTCMKLPQGQDQQMGTINTEKSLEGSDTSMKPTGACTRAGEVGMAFDITSSGNTVHVCYTADGVPLEMTSTAGGVSSSMIATSVSRSVSDSEFVPPATPQDLSALAAQYGAK